MATLNTKRSWKLQYFTAHNANVNCLALGHKSGRVMVTGGDDEKVNLWAVGKPTCFMSLSGHTTPIECVEFNQSEELVCAGSRAGALKLWDLEAAKLLRSLTGHKAAIKCMDFHPYGEFLVSGSADATVKLWDTRRRKGSLFTYNGHKTSVNSVRFSPDGNWFASGGEDACVKLWDLRMGRVLRHFAEHLSAVATVQFHPHEFLLASGGVDRQVNLYDLETFTTVGTERDLGGIVRALCFNTDGECLFVGVRDGLKVLGWEPSTVFDTVPVNWGKVYDMATTQNQLVGASFYLTNVQIFVVDLKKVQPIGGATVEKPAATTNGGGQFLSTNQMIRKSFIKSDRPISLKAMTNSNLNGKSIEENTSGTDPEEEATALVTNLTDYNEIFKGRSISRTPPPLEPNNSYQQEPPEHDYPEERRELLNNKLNKTKHYEQLESNNSNSNYRNNRSKIPQPPPTNNSGNQMKFTRSKSNLDQLYLKSPTLGGGSGGSGKSTASNRENILPVITVRPNNATPNNNNSNNNNNNKLVPPPAVKFPTQKLQSVVPMKHSASDVSISAKQRDTNKTSSQRKNSFSSTPSSSSSTSAKGPLRNSSVPNLVAAKTSNSHQRNHEKFTASDIADEYETFGTKKSKNMGEVEDAEVIPHLIDRPVGLDVDDFLPKNGRSLGFNAQLPDMSEAEVLGALVRGHEPMMRVLITRQRSLKMVLTQLRSKDIKSAMETAVAMNDLSVLVDLLGVCNLKSSIWNLDLCVLVLPHIQELLQSKFETYVQTGCSTIKLILRHFGNVIKNNIHSPAGSFGVDISREERYRKSVKCHETLDKIKTFLNKKQHSTTGTVASIYREIYTLMVTTFD